MLGEQRGVREPGPAPIRVAQEFLVDEFEHHAATRRIGRFRIDARRAEQRILAARIELEQRAQPGGEAPVIELLIRKRVVPAQIEGLQVQHGEARGGLRLAEGGEAQRLRPRRRRQILRGRRLRLTRRLPGKLRAKAHAEREPQPARHRAERALARVQKFRRWKSNKPATTSSAV